MDNEKINNIVTSNDVNKPIKYPNVCCNKFVKWFLNNKSKIYGFLFTILTGYLLFYICVGCKFYINSDSTFIVDYAEEQIKTKHFFPSNWVHGNDIWVYSLVPLINIFIRIGMSLYMSRQVAVIIQSVLLILLVVNLYGKEIEYKTGGRIVLFLILSGISGMFIFELFGDATYGTVIFFMLLLLLLFLKILKNRKNSTELLALFGVILTILTSCSLRFPIFVATPLICVLLYLSYTYKVKKEYISLGIILVFSVFIGIIGHKLLQDNLIYIQKFDEKGLVSDSNKLFSNISETLYYYFSMCGCTYLNTKGLTIIGFNDYIAPSSPFIALSFVRFVFAVVSIMLPFVLFKHLNKMNIGEKVVYIYTISLMIFILFFQIIANMSSWHRYITPVLFFQLFLYPIAYRYIFANLLKKRIVFDLFLTACVMTSLFFVSTSIFDISFINNKASIIVTSKAEQKGLNKEPILKLKKNDYIEVIDFLKKKNLHFGYCAFGMEHNIYNTLSNGEVRVCQLASNGYEPRKWLCSLDWFEPEFYDGKVFLIRKRNQKALAVESVSDSKCDLGEFTIIKFSSNELFLDKLNELKQKASK